MFRTQNALRTAPTLVHHRFRQAHGVRSQAGWQARACFRHPRPRYDGNGRVLSRHASSMVTHLGRTLMWLGAALFLAGALLYFSPKLPLRLGRLPGDIVIRGKNSVFYFPLMTSILLSLVFSILLWLFRRR
jgi:hypothetical protein